MDDFDGYEESDSGLFEEKNGEVVWFCFLDSLFESRFYLGAGFVR